MLNVRRREPPPGDAAYQALGRLAGSPPAGAEAPLAAAAGGGEPAGDLPRAGGGGVRGLAGSPEGAA